MRKIKKGSIGSMEKLATEFYGNIRLDDEDILKDRAKSQKLCLFFIISDLINNYTVPFFTEAGERITIDQLHRRDYDILPENELIEVLSRTHLNDTNALLLGTYNLIIKNAPATFHPQYDIGIDDYDGYRTILAKWIIDGSWSLENNSAYTLHYGICLYNILEQIVIEDKWTRETSLLLNTVDYCINNVIDHTKGVIEDLKKCFEKEEEMRKKEATNAKRNETSRETYNTRDTKLLDFIYEKAKKGTFDKLKRDTVTTLAKKIALEVANYNQSADSKNTIAAEDFQTITTKLKVYYKLETHGKLPKNYVEILKTRIRP